MLTFLHIIQQNFNYYRIKICHWIKKGVFVSQNKSKGIFFFFIGVLSRCHIKGRKLCKRMNSNIWQLGKTVIIHYNRGKECET